MARAGVRCVVFDVDDTLYLERDYVWSGFRAAGEWVAGAFGLRDFAERAWAEFEGGRRLDIFDRVLLSGGVEVDRAVVAQLVRRYREHLPAIRLLPDARRSLDALHGDVALAAVSDGPFASQRAKVEALGLSRWLAPMVLTAELGEGLGKPHPGAFRIVEEATGCSGPACVYVADNPSKDFAGPASLGWRTIRVRREGGLHQSLPSGADVEIEIADLTALPALLRPGA